jgi:hypothetical protein
MEREAAKCLIVQVAVAAISDSLEKRKKLWELRQEEEEEEGVEKKKGDKPSHVTRSQMNHVFEKENRERALNKTPNTAFCKKGRRKRNATRHLRSFVPVQLCIKLWVRAAALQLLIHLAHWTIMRSANCATAVSIPRFISGRCSDLTD